MKNLLLLMAILMSGTLFLAGCEGESDDSPANPVVVATNTPAAPDANALFSAITPAGLALQDKFTIAGRGTVYILQCTAIAGATSYTFTTSFGASSTVAVPTVSVQKSGADVKFTFSVYASNAEGFNTRTASATVEPSPISLAAGIVHQCGKPCPAGGRAVDGLSSNNQRRR